MVFREAISKYFKGSVLKAFFKIDLSNIEKGIAEDSVKTKYVPVVLSALIQGLFILPAIIFLDSGILMSVLIPITMVTGSAWFAISLANMREKFESFGLELTTAMFDAFVTSLVILGLLTLVSLNTAFFEPLRIFAEPFWFIHLIAGILGTFVVFKVLFNVFSGALKYDINDAMLTGQNEAAERFFKKSLSLLHSSAENLRTGKGLEVANYYLGLSFYEIFSFVKQAEGNCGVPLDEMLRDSKELRGSPSMPQKKADKLSIKLIETFVSCCKNVEGAKATKSFESIKEEIASIKNNPNESQFVVDSRLSTIFEEIAELIEYQGGALFREK
ncbi:MAG: hypothetical protein ABIA76_04050 [Candidatus Diapherotrites archaeon]